MENFELRRIVSKRKTDDAGDNDNNFHELHQMWWYRVLSLIYFHCSAKFIIIIYVNVREPKENIKIYL